MVKQPHPPGPPEMPLEHQKFLAFEHLLGWTAAVIAQSERLTEARNALLATYKERAERAQKYPEQWGKTWKEHELACRMAIERFQTERHLFCNAAFKLLEYSQWVRQLGLLDDATFIDLDRFADDIKVMRDKKLRIALEMKAIHTRRPKEKLICKEPTAAERRRQTAAQARHAALELLL
jgi:hypothetical protein